MAEVIGERVAALIEANRSSQSQLAKAIGVSQPTIGRLISGETRETGKLLELASALNTTPEYLVGRTDDSGVFEFRGSGDDFKEAAKLFAVDEDAIEIASIDFAYGFGGAYLDAGDPEVERVRFSRAWLRSQGITAPPEVLGFAQGIGDSMEPLFYDRDVIVFDRSARLEDHLADKMWVFAFGQVGMVKRLRPMPDGSIKIMSVNRTYPDEIASAEEIYIIGRVVGSWRKY